MGVANVGKLKKSSNGEQIYQTIIICLLVMHSNRSMYGESQKMKMKKDIIWSVLTDGSTTNVIVLGGGRDSCFVIGIDS